MHLNPSYMPWNNGQMFSVPSYRLMFQTIQLIYLQVKCFRFCARLYVPDYMFQIMCSMQIICSRFYFSDFVPGYTFQTIRSRLHVPVYTLQVLDSWILLKFLGFNSWFLVLKLRFQVSL